MKTKVLPIKPTNDMINAAYMLIETMPKGTDARHMRIVAEVYEAMAECAPLPTVTGLTPRMRTALEFICEYVDEHGRSPSFDEIGEHMGRVKSDIFHIVKGLKRRGFINYGYGARRSIRVLVRPGETKS